MEYIEEETMVTATEDPFPWHLDRINQDDLLLDGNLGIGGTGEGVNIYILDTG